MDGKVQKTSHEESEKAKREAWLALSPEERLTWHQEMLRRIYGDRYNAPLSEEAKKVKVRRIKG